MTGTVTVVLRLGEPLSAGPGLGSTEAGGCGPAPHHDDYGSPRQPSWNLRAPTRLRVSARTRLAGPKPDSEGAAASGRSSKSLRAQVPLWLAVSRGGPAAADSDCDQAGTWRQASPPGTRAQAEQVSVSPPAVAAAASGHLHTMPARRNISQSG